MRILISCEILEISGTPIYTLNLYRELVKRGHDVAVYSPKGGILSDQFANWTNNLYEFSREPDIMIGQMNNCAEGMKARYPDIPMLFSSHGVPYMGTDGKMRCTTETPPKCKVEWFTAINEQVAEMLIASGAPQNKVSIIRDFVDCDKFKLKRSLNKNLQNVLYISNYKKWRSWARVDKACKELEVNLKCIGSPYHRSTDVAKDINEADLVVTVGRGVIEAMACGRPVVSFDQMHGDGYITLDNYFKSREHQFFNNECKYTFEDYHDLVKEMQKYNPIDGSTNRILAREFHNAIIEVDKLEVIFALLRAAYGKT